MVTPLAGDSDADTIADQHEGVPTGIDTDEDGTPDSRDADSDNDTILDRDEAGDVNINTYPIDTDRDGEPDFRDTDSDGDGLADRLEAERGSSPVREDSDGDGATDLIEAAAGTDPNVAAQNPRARGDFVFVVPYEREPTPVRETLSFGTRIRTADVYFLMDNTQSMGGYIRTLQESIRSQLVPRLRAEIFDVLFGVGGFDDYPIPTVDVITTRLRFGALNSECNPTRSDTDSLGIVHDSPFFQYQELTSNLDLIETAVGRYAEHCGSDSPEAGVAALYALATGDSLGGYARYGSATRTSAAPCPEGGLGAACFRPNSVPVIVFMSDEAQHNAPTCDLVGGGCGPGTCRSCDYGSEIPHAPTYEATIAALRNLRARVVAITVDGGLRGIAFAERLVADTTLQLGATGVASDYVFRADYSGVQLPDRIVQAVQAAVSGVPIDVSARIRDVQRPGEDTDAVAAFVERIEARRETSATVACTAGLETYDRPALDSDEVPDSFRRVTPGRPVCFDVVAKRNTTVMPPREPRLFEAHIEVIDAADTQLDERSVYFLVPPIIPKPNDPF